MLDGKSARMSKNSPVDLLRMPQTLALEFFAVFSRFEFGLKNSGFLYIHRGRAVPDWTLFCEQAQLESKDDPGLTQSIEMLVCAPPLVQVSAHEWKEVPLRGSTRQAKALDAAQRVRHNLFHGGKYAAHSAEGRDEALVRAALEVLRACVDQNGRISESFYT